MKKIILHIGMHKTGTTSIQKALRGFDDGKTVYAKLSYENHSIPFATAFSDDYLNYHIWKRQGLSNSQIEEKKQECLSEIKSALSDDHYQRIVFSGEGISVLTKSELEKLHSFLWQYSNDISIYAYIRHPGEYFTSHLQERIKNNRAYIGMSELYRLRFEKFISRFGASKVNLRRYDPGTFVDGDVVQDFCNWIGLDKLSGKKIELNASFSTETVQCLYILNNSNPLSDGDVALNSARNNLARQLQTLFPGKFRIPEKIVLAQIDRQDVSWMEEVLNTDFMLPPKHTGSLRSSLEEHLGNISDDVIDGLIGYLNSINIEGDFDRDPVKLINRLFYSCFTEPSKLCRPNRLQRWRNRLFQCT